jgi:hypothetical protein
MAAFSYMHMEYAWYNRDLIAQVPSLKGGDPFNQYIIPVNPRQAVPVSGIAWTPVPNPPTTQSMFKAVVQNSAALSGIPSAVSAETKPKFVTMKGQLLPVSPTVLKMMEGKLIEPFIQKPEKMGAGTILAVAGAGLLLLRLLRS